MWLNSTSQSAIRAVAHVAARGLDGPVRVEEIARAARCPRNYLSKILHVLTRAGVLQSSRGPAGGFRLVGRPERVALAEVIAPFQSAVARRCVLGRPECGGARPCAAHDRWTRVAAQVESFFAKTTVADLLESNRARRRLK